MRTPLVALLLMPAWVIVHSRTQTVPSFFPILKDDIRNYFSGNPEQEQKINNARFLFIASKREVTVFLVTFLVEEEAAEKVGKGHHLYQRSLNILKHSKHTKGMEKAQQFLMKAAEMGSQKAMENLAADMLFGFNGPQDVKAAISLYEILAEEGSHKGQTNYRLVANIPFLGKAFERVVAGQLQALLDETDYLDPFQSGFRPGYGTESALVALYDDLCREKDMGSASLLVLLDLSVAFDTIDHGEAVAVLNWCLAKVMGWMRANKLKLNPDKTEVLLVGGSSSWVGGLDLALDGVALPLKDRVHSLGVLLDPELSLEAQVTAESTLITWTTCCFQCCGAYRNDDDGEEEDDNDDNNNNLRGMTYEF
ncbi:hypothetical protein EYD10_05220 [Varanus komodoensis]|nr:hypothetical protein EYD10_05220 [Varanus komodoensis]